MPTFVTCVIHRDTGKSEYLIREATAEHELRELLSNEGLIVRSIRPAEFGGEGARFEIRTPKGRVAGPFGPDILRAMVRDDHLTPLCSIRKTGDLNTHAWLPAWKVNGLFPGHVVDSIRRTHEVGPEDDDQTAKLKSLKRQLDEGLIDERDYRFKKGELLGVPYDIEESPKARPQVDTRALAVMPVSSHAAESVKPAGRIVNVANKGNTMYCSECGNQLLGRAIICPTCGCPTRKYNSLTKSDTGVGSGNIALCYALSFLFPIGGIISSIFLFIKGKAGHAVIVIILSLFFMFLFYMFYWKDFFEALADQGY